MARVTVSIVKQINVQPPHHFFQPVELTRQFKTGTPPALSFTTLTEASPQEEGIAAVGTFNRSLTNVLLIGCAVSALTSLPVMADGNGVIVLERQVQPIPIGRNGGKDPYPTAVSANPSANVVQATRNGELSDSDFAGVASGSSISNMINFNGAGPQGLNVVSGSNGIPGVGGGSGATAGAGAGASISGTINRSLSTGLAPLTNLGGAMK